MNKSSGISYLKPEHRFASDLDKSAIDTINALSTTACDELAAMLQNMFDGIDDSFFELANSARTNNEQNRFFEAMRETRIKRKGIESSFLEMVRSLFKHQKVIAQPEQTSSQNSSSLENLSLIQNEALEEEVAINSMSNKAQANFQGPLLQFQTRAANLYGMKSGDQISSPLNPQTICELFAQACAPIEIEIRERLIIFKQFDRYVMANFEHIVNSANKILIRNGIMPSLKTPGIKHNAPARQPGTSTPSTGYTRNNQTEEHSSGNPSLQSLLNRVRTAHANQNSVAEATPSRRSNEIIDSGNLQSLLTGIQRKQSNQLEAAPSLKTEMDIKSTIRQELASLDRPALKQVDEDLINLVTMLFEFILEDYNLAPSIQALLGRLQIPVLKVVISDRSFFSSSKHPARQLLNNLAKSGIGWAETQDTSKDKLYQKMHQVVYRVLHDFDGDTGLFEKLNTEYTDFIAKENRRASIVENRTQEAEKGRIKSRQAQQKVEKILSNKILNTHYPIPDLIIETLKNGWSRVMFLAYLKDEQEHQWHNCVKAVDDLIWCLQPAYEHSDRQKWVKVVPRLLKDLRIGLEAVSYNSSELNDTLSEIQSLLTSNFKNGELPVRQTNTGKPSTATKPQTDSSARHEEATVDTEYADEVSGELMPELETVKQLKLGDWLEFQMKNGNKLRCKLSTKIEEADCYIFVNRMGLKSIEKTSMELAKDLQNKQAIILAQGQIIDRAMSAVLSNLRLK